MSQFVKISQLPTVDAFKSALESTDELEVLVRDSGIPLGNVRVSIEQLLSLLEFQSDGTGTVIFDRQDNIITLKTITGDGIVTVQDTGDGIQISVSGLSTVATSGSYNDLNDLPDLFDGDYGSLTNTPDLAPVATSGSYNDLDDLPDLAPVATSGSYNDLEDLPDLFDGDYDSLNNIPTFAEVAFSGDYEDLINTPEPAAILDSISNLDSTPGILVQVGADTVEKRSVIGSPSLLVTNGNGEEGDILVDLDGDEEFPPPLASYATDMDGNRGWYRPALFESTGLLSGGVVTINSMDNTRFDVAQLIAGRVSYSNPMSPLRELKALGPFSSQAVTNIGTQNVTYLGVDVSTEQLVQQQNPFSNSQRRSIVPLAVLVHSNFTNLNAINLIPSVIRSGVNQIEDLMAALGSINVSGNVLSPGGSNLTINKSSGQIFRSGINFANDETNPHVISLSQLTPASFRYRLSDGTEYADTSNIDVGFYESPLGTRTSIGGANRYSVQRVTLFPSNLIRIQYGQEWYHSIIEAEAALGTEPFVTENNIATNGTLIGFLVVRNNATDLSNPAQAKFIRATKFGSPLATGGASITTTDALNEGSVNLYFTADRVENVLEAYEGFDDRYIQLSEKGEPLGVATLNEHGKVPSGQLPALVVTDTFVVNSESAMLDLEAAEQGDVAIRTDLNKSFILVQSPSSTLGNWQELLSPTSAVSSVFGRTGAIAAESGDYSAFYAPTSHVGTGGSEHPNATTSVSGFMSSSDKTKLDGIATAATANSGSASIIDVSGSFQRAALTGDVTSAQNSNTTTISNGAVSNSKIADMVQATIKGRAAGAGTGAPVDLTAAQVRTIINVADGATANVGTVTSVGLTVPAGMIVSGSPVTDAGTLGVSVDNAATFRSTIGATTVGSNVFTLTNPNAIRFLRINADNTVTALTAADFRTAIGAGTGNGTVTSVGLSMPASFSVTNSPITGAGTLTVTHATGFQGYTSTEASKLAGIEAGATIGATWGVNISGIPTNINSWADIAPSAKQDALTNSTSNTISGTQVQRAALTGDVTAAANSNATSIANGAVTLAKMANLAANSIIGNNTGSAMTPIALTAAQTRTLLELGTAALQNTGTSGANVPLLNGSNTWSGQQTFTGTNGTDILLIQNNSATAAGNPFLSFNKFNNTTFQITGWNGSSTEGSLNIALPDGVTVTGPIQSTGTAASLWFQQRDGSTMFALYHTASLTRLFNGSSDVVTINNDGHLRLATAGGAPAGTLDAATSAGRVLIRASGGGRNTIDSVNAANNAFLPMEFTATEFIFSGGPIVDSIGNVRNIPAVARNSNTAFSAADAGRAIVKDNTTAYTWAVNTGVWSAGMSVVVLNDGTAGNVTISQGSGMNLVHGTSSGNFTLQPGQSRTLLGLSTTRVRIL